MRIPISFWPSFGPVEGYVQLHSKTWPRQPSLEGKTVRLNLAQHSRSHTLSCFNSCHIYSLRDYRLTLQDSHILLGESFRFSLQTEGIERFPETYLVWERLNSLSWLNSENKTNSSLTNASNCLELIKTPLTLNSPL